MSEPIRLKRGERGRFNLWLQDEAPRLGSGCRTVDVHVGNSKVKLTSPWTGRSTRISRVTFDLVLNNTIRQIGLRKACDF